MQKIIVILPFPGSGNRSSTGASSGDRAWFRISLVVPVTLLVRNSVPVGSY